MNVDSILQWFQLTSDKDFISSDVIKSNLTSSQFNDIHEKCSDECGPWSMKENKEQNGEKFAGVLFAR